MQLARSSLQSVSSATVDPGPLPAVGIARWYTRLIGIVVPA